MFSSTLAGIFFRAGRLFDAFSPYSFIGSERELLSMMSDEPMIILMAIGMYMVTGSFYVSDIVAFQTPTAYYLPGIFRGVSVRADHQDEKISV